MNIYEQYTSPGPLLLEIRQEKQISIDEVCETLRIRDIYITALEADAYDALPGESYVRGYLREYARLLGLEPQKVLELYLGWREQALVQPEEAYVPHTFWQKYGPAPWMLWGLPVVLLLGGVIWSIQRGDMVWPERVSAVPEHWLIRYGVEELATIPQEKDNEAYWASFLAWPENPHPHACPYRCMVVESAASWPQICGQDL